MAKVRKIPKRMCIGCQEMKIKKELIRIVKTPENDMDIDPTGKKSGRGAYICPKKDCLEKAIKGNRIERALKQPVTTEVKERLRQGLGE